jgi:hypothetical protein
MENMAFLVIGQKQRVCSFGKRRTAVRWRQALWQSREWPSGFGSFEPNQLALDVRTHRSGFRAAAFFPGPIFGPRDHQVEETFFAGF